jgi:ELWxxDGT repeat protein
MLKLNSVNVSDSTVLFIARNVENYSSLLEEINSEIAVFIIDTERDGVRQITEVLKENNYSQVHIISHGTPGCLYLGNSQLNLDTLDKYQAELQSWYSTPLSKGGRGELFLYGCNVAAGDAGAEFLAKLHQLTAASVAASTSLTGNEELGGNWNLEVTVGEVVADVVLTEAAMASYQGVLAQVTLVKNIRPGLFTGSYPRDLTEFNGKLYFAADNRINGVSNGGELWVSDGTTGGTRLVKDISSSSADSSPRGFILRLRIVSMAESYG